MTPLTTFADGLPVTTLRGLRADALSQTGNWLTLSGTSDSGGGATITWGTAGSALPCRVAPLTGSESVVADRLDDRSTHKIITLPTTGVSHKDRWVVGSTTYEITAVRARTAEWVRVFEAVVLE